jgi:hypothetical protein
MAESGRKQLAPFALSGAAFAVRRYQLRAPALDLVLWQQYLVLVPDDVSNHKTCSERQQTQPAMPWPRSPFQAGVQPETLSTVSICGPANGMCTELQRHGCLLDSVAVGVHCVIHVSSLCLRVLQFNAPSVFEFSCFKN